MNILVVDDDPMVVESCRRILSQPGYTVFASGDVNTALDLLRTGKPVQLLVTDIKMPGPDGFFLVEQVKQIFPETAVLMMTGYLVPETERKGAGVGAHGCISKPFTPKELTDAVEKAIAATKA